MTRLEAERPPSAAEWRAAGATFEYRGHRAFQDIGRYRQIEDPVAVMRELLAFIRPGSD
jgi:hypothetical protein